MLGLLVVVAVLAVSAMGIATGAPGLSAAGPTSVGGTAKTAVFELGGRRIRQVRYVDQGTLVYRFELVNHGRLPVTVTGLAELDRPPRLLHYLELTGPDGEPRFTVPGDGAVDVGLTMRMSGCETLSSRAGSFASVVRLRTERAAMFENVVRVTLPEEVHTGSPREALCPEATATSRSPG